MKPRMQPPGVVSRSGSGSGRVTCREPHGILRPRSSGDRPRKTWRRSLRINARLVNIGAHSSNRSGSRWSWSLLIGDSPPLWTVPKLSRLGQGQWADGESVLKPIGQTPILKHDFPYHRGTAYPRHATVTLYPLDRGAPRCHLCSQGYPHSMKRHRPQQDQRRRVGRDQLPPPRGARSFDRVRARRSRAAGSSAVMLAFSVGCRRDGHRAAEGHRPRWRPKPALRASPFTLPIMQSPTDNTVHSPRATPGYPGCAGAIRCSRMPPTPGTRRPAFRSRCRTESSVRTPTAWNFTTIDGPRDHRGQQRIQPTAREPAPRQTRACHRPDDVRYPAHLQGVVGPCRSPRG